jgi:ethanolamine utilization protein EutQ
VDLGSIRAPYGFVDMPRQLFTAEDIRRLAREKTDALVLGKGDIITPEATDIAYSLGVKLIRGTDPGVGLRQDPPRIPALPPLKVIHGAGLALEPFLEGLATPGTDVRLKDVVTAHDRSPVGAGFMSLNKGELKWTLTYDEIDIVLEGELVITRGGEQVRGSPGDVIYISKGSSITFGAPKPTRFVYVVFPVNWNEK